MSLVLFDPSHLEEMYNKALADLPADHTIAVVGTIDNTGAAVEVVFKKQLSVLGTNVDWHAVAAYHLGFDGAQSYGAKIVISG